MLQAIIDRQVALLRTECISSRGNQYLMNYSDHRKLLVKFEKLFPTLEWRFINKNLSCFFFEKKLKSDEYEMFTTA